MKSLVTQEGDQWIFGWGSTDAPHTYIIILYCRMSIFWFIPRLIQRVCTFAINISIWNISIYTNMYLFYTRWNTDTYDDVDRMENDFFGHLFDGNRKSDVRIAICINIIFVILPFRKGLAGVCVVFHRRARSVSVLLGPSVHCPSVKSSYGTRSLIRA